eukprot:COSAG01_NODE_26036_length_725_cov_1.337061_2_plen_93_part_00
MGLIGTSRRRGGWPGRGRGPWRRTILISWEVMEWKSGSMKAAGKSSPPLMPRLLRRKASRVMRSLSFSCGECWFVFLSWGARIDRDQNWSRD